MTLGHYGRVLCIAPHPDDEILGCGGTLARMVDEGLDVQVAVVTAGQPPAFSAEQVKQVHDEALRAHAMIGIAATHWLGLPAAALDTIPAAELNGAVDRMIRDVSPDTLLVPFPGDVHRDHQLTFLAAMVASRPRHAQSPARVLAYETLSETNWYAAPTTPAFVPTLFIDISTTLERKLAAFTAFASQVKAYPDERSLLSIESLARMRGAAAYLHAAEGFVAVRMIER